MFSRSLLARSSPLRLSAVLSTRVCSRPLSTLRLPHAARTAPWCASIRRFSDIPEFRTEDRRAARSAHTPTGTCYVANIPYRVTAEQLKDAFSEFGKIVSVRLLTTESGLSRGVAFIQFEAVEDAVKFYDAHMADPMFVLDRQVHVEHAQGTKNVAQPAEPSDTLVVLQFQGESDVEARDLFGSYASNILAVRFDKREANRASRKAFVQFRDVDAATDAMHIFKNQNGNALIGFAKQRQPPANAYTLTSRLSQHRDDSRDDF